MADIPTRSIPDILRDAVGHIQEIVRSEIRLAKVEVTEQAGKARNAGIMLGAGSVFGLFAAALLLAACVCALALVMAAWLAALVIAILCGIIGAALLAMGRTRLKQVNPKPEKTVQTLREDVEWARNQTR